MTCQPMRFHCRVFLRATKGEAGNIELELPEAVSTASRKVKMHMRPPQKEAELKALDTSLEALDTSLEHLGPATPETVAAYQIFH